MRAVADQLLFRRAMIIDNVRTEAEIAATFDVLRQLRPHLTRDSFVPVVRSLMASDFYRLASLMDEGAVRAVAGYRIMNMLYCRLLYVDDLVTDERVRSRGYGTQMMRWLIEQARREGCAELQLISRVEREQAHRFYYRAGLGIECFHFRIKLT